MSNLNYMEPVSFLYRLKHPHLNKDVDPENFRHFLGLCEIEFEDSEEGCVNYIFEKMYNVRPFAQPTKIEHLIEVVKNLQDVNFAIIQKEGVYYYSTKNNFEKAKTILVYGNHAYLIHDISLLIELDPLSDLNAKFPIKRVKLQGYTKGSKALCKRCLCKYSPSPYFDVGYCTITCAALGLPINKKCKACETEYLTVKFLDNSYCSLMCRCFPTKDQQAKMELFFDKSKEDLLSQYRNDFLDNQEITMMYAAEDFFKRLESGQLTREEIIKLHKKILEKNIKVELKQPLVYENLLDNKEEVFKNKPALKLGYERYKVNGGNWIWEDPLEEIVPKMLPRDEEGYYYKHKSQQYLDQYTLNLDPLLLQDLKENIMTHEHLCFSCGNTYTHSHKYFNKEHPQFLRQCGNLDCKMFGLKSKAKVIENSLFDINTRSIFSTEEVVKPVINSLNIVNPKPNFSLNKLNNYEGGYLSKVFKNGEKEHPHPNLAFDRFFLEKWMYTQVITEPHYVMAAAPKRISKYNDENFYSVPYVVETDLDRQEELRYVPNKFCYHKLEDCNHLKDFEILTGTHTLYYITKENYKYIKHMKYMVFVVHLYFDNLPPEEVEIIEFNVNIRMSVRGNKVSYNHPHPLEALRLLNQDFNIVVIGSMAYTQVLFLTNRKLSKGNSDFLSRYENGLALRGVTGNEKDFEMLESEFDIY